MGMPCFLIVSVIAATSPASAPRMSPGASPPSPKVHATVARALPEPPPMVRGQRSAHRSIRHLAADPPGLAMPASTGPVARR
jgi:hypothetical protein